ncbi:alpha/beta hydrolase [Geomonas sp. Red875]|uniref:Alpha/beta hydrolase n=1 Tax=Geomesophilobacter sediminis TaxID=2798584 RepID=A0A8J7M0T8_9BACT|nr:alpha/beta hydrolase [Geomesophilobacter sediminis]
MFKYLLLMMGLPLLLTCQGCVGRLFYYPDSNVYQTPANFGLRYDSVTFPSTDGNILSGWFVPAVGPAKGTVIHYHGNAQNMTAHFSFVSWLPAEGFNVFVFDYRGYGKSTGHPDRKGVFEDSVAAARYVATRKDVDPERLLIFGQSLGGANAIAAAGSGQLRGIRAVAIESAFSSSRSIVREKIGLIPVLSLLKWPLSYLLIGDSYSAIAAVDKISPVPLLLIYETRDPVIPISEGRKLFDKAKQPKEFWTLEAKSHAGAFVEKNSPYRPQLVKFFTDAVESVKR